MLKKNSALEVVLFTPPEDKCTPLNGSDPLRIVVQENDGYIYDDMAEKIVFKNAEALAKMNRDLLTPASYAIHSSNKNSLILLTNITNSFWLMAKRVFHSQTVLLLLKIAALFILNLVLSLLSLLMLASFLYENTSFCFDQKD